MFCERYASVFPILNSAYFVSSVIELPTTKSFNSTALLTATNSSPGHWVVAEIGPDGFCPIPDSVQIWSRSGPDLVQTEVHGCPDQKIWTACLDMLSRFWTGPDHSGLVQSAFSCVCRCTWNNLRKAQWAHSFACM
jgi:hypothetical protein